MKSRAQSQPLRFAAALAAGVCLGTPAHAQDTTPEQPDAGEHPQHAPNPHGRAPGFSLDPEGDARDRAARQQIQRLLDAPPDEHPDAVARLLALGPTAPLDVLLAARAGTSRDEPSRDEPSRDELSRDELSEDVSHPALPAFLQALVRRATAPRWLVSPLASLARTPGSQRLPAVEALSSVRAVEAIEVLVTLLDDEDEALRSAADTALVRLSAREDLAGRVEGWRAYLDSMKAMAPSDRERALLGAIAARTDRLAAARAVAEAELVAVYRRLHLRTPPEERSVLLASMLLDPIDAVRDVGFELVGREIGAGTPLDTSVEQAALSLLAHPDPGTRARAAVLTARLAPQDAGPSVAAALVAERDPDAAAALLLAGARWPNSAIVDPTAAWLERDGVTFHAAADAALALERAGRLREAGVQPRVLAALRARPIELVNPAGLRLLVTLGDERDVGALADRLATTDEPARRRALADALADAPTAVDVLVEAADVHPELYAQAARTLERHRATPAGFAQLSALPAPTDASRREALLALAARLSVPGVLDAVQRVELALAIEILASRVAASPDLRPRVRLAELYLDADRPDQALTATEAAGSPEDASLRARVDGARISALCALDRVDDALAIDATLETWLDCLEGETDPVKRARIATHVLKRFENIDEATTAQLQAIVTAGARRLPGPDEAPEQDPPPDQTPPED